jgi:hypothetical protein
MEASELKVTRPTARLLKIIFLALIAPWLRGCVAAWLRGCVAAWLRGCVVLEGGCSNIAATLFVGSLGLHVVTIPIGILLLCLWTYDRIVAFAKLRNGSRPQQP